MKMELKVFIMSLMICLLFVGVFTYFTHSLQKNYYVLQVGIYSKEDNKDTKVKELQNLGVTADYYNYDEKYYVFSFISDSKEEVEKYQSDNNIEGIIKTYNAYIQEDSDAFLKRLKEGEI